MARDVTLLLRRWREGDPQALDELIPLVYDELRRQARGAMRAERAGHTLQPTALVHETFVRLLPQNEKDWQSRQHFFAVAANLMRQVLVDHARRRRARKRDGGTRVELDEATFLAREGDSRVVDVLELDRALEDLAQLDPERASVVELRCFGGLTLKEIAASRGAEEWSIKKDWKLARAWLSRRLRSAR